MMLEPWIIEAALKRLGSRQLTEEEQKAVFVATRTPKKVRWPTWWAVHLYTGTLMSDADQDPMETFAAGLPGDYSRQKAKE